MTAISLHPDTGGKHAPADRGRHIRLGFSLTYKGLREMATHTLIEEENEKRIAMDLPPRKHYLPPIDGEDDG